uniref:aggregation-promoting factor C-terminal-like domain-containing protein n=1 Tax=uncultured Deinococcus sp. TaxID=158789 RepID=UPI0025DF5EE4
SGARSIAAADAALVDAQRALSQALSQTGTAGQAAGDKVAAAFANLSPAAAAFARYLFGLQDELQGLSATAASAFFPPLMAGIQALVGQLPIINTVVGQLAGAMGAALSAVLTELASPFWIGFFQMLGNAASTILPPLIAALLAVARAGAGLVTALMPLAGPAIGIVTMLAGLITSLTPFLVQLLGGLIPAAAAFLSALTPLGPVLAALQPILLVLAQALSMVLGAFLTALAPILVALTPLIQALAMQIAAGLVASLQAATPWLVRVAQWMSANPGLVMGVVSAIGTLLGFLKPLAFVAGLVVGALHNWLIITVVRSLLTGLGLESSVVGGLLLRLLSPINLIKMALPLIGRAVMFLGRSFFAAMGPIGWIITAFGLLYSTSQPFRQAVNGLLGVVMALVGQLAGAFMPILAALSNVLRLVAGVFSMLVTQLAMALIPVINLVAGVLIQLVASILPPLMQIVRALVPVIAMLAQVFIGVLMAVLGPVIGALGQLIAAVLPPLVMLLQAVVIPVITFLAQLLSGVLAWVITSVLVPALQFLTPIITWLAGVLSTVLAWVITTIVVPALNLLVPIFQWIGAAAVWLWTNVLQPTWNALSTAWTAVVTAMQWAWANILEPVFDAIGFVVRVLIAIILTVLITPLMLAWQGLMIVMQWAWTNILLPVWLAIQAVAAWLWATILRPIFAAIGAAWNALIVAMKWAWDTILHPVWTAIQVALGWLYVNVWLPIMAGLKREWQFFADALNAVWLNVIKPAWDAVAGGLGWLRDRFNDGVNQIGRLWAGLKALLARPINFMIDTVWNHGVVPAWNAVAGLVGLGPIAPLGLIPEMNAGGYLGDTARRDSRGMLHGPGSPTSDSILGISGAGIPTVKVSRDEMIMNAAVTKRALPFLSALNAGDGEALQAAGALQRVSPKQWRGGRSGFNLNVPGRAAGGPVEARISEAKKWLSGPARGAPYVYGGGTNPRRGMDCSSMQSAVTHILSGRPPDSGRIGTTASMPWSGFAPGLNSAYAIGNKPNDHMAGTLAGQNVEQHGPDGTPFSFPSRWGADNGYFTQQYNLPVVGGQFVSGGEGSGGFFNWILDKARTAFDDLTNPAIDAVKAFVGAPPPEWRRVPPALATKIRDTARDFVFGKAEDAGGSMDVSGISGPVVDQVRAVAAKLGWDTGPQWDNGIFPLVAKESGWNPNAANPTSSARGLFQKMTSIHGPIEPTPAGQAAWGLNYIKQTYGDPVAAWAFHRSHNWYDDGGVARGKGLMMKQVIADERVLDPIQTGEYDTLTAYRQMIESGQLAPASGPSAKQITEMTRGTDGAHFPTEFEITGGRLEVGGDGIGEMVDVRLRAVESVITTGRDD